MEEWPKRRQRLKTILRLDDQELETYHDAKCKSEAKDLVLRAKEDFRLLETLVQTPQSSVCIVSTPLSRPGAVFVKKSVSKCWADQMKGQTSPIIERQILLQASKAGRLDVPRLLCALQDVESLHIFLEYAARGSLWDLMESCEEGKVSETVLRPWIVQSVEALHWLHTRGWVHRDIKPHNMLISLANKIQITDFGSAAPLQGPNQQVPQQYCTCVVGTIDYIPPEVLLAHQDALALMDLSSTLPIEPPVIREGDLSSLDSRIDSWSLGVVLYEALCGEAPFFHEAIAATYQNILDHQETLTFPTTNDVAISHHCLDFMQQCLTSLEDRATMQQLLTHPFLSARSSSTLVTMPPIRYPKNPLSASKTFSSTQSRPFDFSIFFSSPGLEALRQSRNSRSPSLGLNQASDWSAFTYLPSSDIFSQPEFAPLPPAPILKKATPSPVSFVTPARPARPDLYRGTTTTARKKRPVSDLQAFAETLEYGLLSVRKKRSASKSRANSKPSLEKVQEQVVAPETEIEEQKKSVWDQYESRQKGLLRDLDGLEVKYSKLLSR